MELKTTIEFGNYYHIYNRGNNRIDIFYEVENYYHFLRLYDKYITPVADTFAWCLLKNHFHVLVRIKNKEEILPEQLSYSTVEKPSRIDPSRQISHFFNAYTQAINKKYKRTGSLFEKPFERKLVTNYKHFQKLIYYIHNNPVHHGFTDNLITYPWTSYETVVSEKKTKLKRESVLEIFTDRENFISFHARKQTINEINDLIIE